MTSSKIIYTLTDEAPALATYSFLPIVQAFTRAADIKIETKNISLAGRILANFPDNLKEDQKEHDALAELGDLAKKPEANIIKLPNISASVPQLNAAIEELQEHGFDIPDYPKKPKTKAEKVLKSRYAAVQGSAVNPVLREGNSDRRVAPAVKQFAKNNPHRMGEWSADSKTQVVSMPDGDFYSREQSVIMPSADEVKIEFTDIEGNKTIFRESIALEEKEIIDGTYADVKILAEFYETAMQEAKANDLLLSLHLKCTMMKVTDPITFGHAVKVYYKDVYEKHADLFNDLGVDPNNGVGDIYEKIINLSPEQQAEIKADIEAVYKTRPALAMADSTKGITNLHAPNNMIIDASMPAAIRAGGKMWNADDQLQDTMAMIPGRTYAGIYQATIDFCKENGAFDVATMGNVSNIGLMAKKAEEYGSHDKTFSAPADGSFAVINSAGETLMEHQVSSGDTWRMCQTKDEPIRDWVKLAVNRARITGLPAIFWLDPKRDHDVSLIKTVKKYLKDHDINGLDIHIMSPIEAMHYTLQRTKVGLDTISVTGNVLRDYLTDLFPILELGTSAKMLSIVPLLAGGGLFETGAGGSAPKHVEQFTKENHLRWDSLGEYLALGVSLEDLAEKAGNKKAQVLAEALNEANSQYLINNKSPSRLVNELDNRGSCFYLTLYWAQALAKQTSDTDLQTRFSPFAQALEENKEKIIDELNSVKGEAVDLGGYYQPDVAKISAAMRPSATFNEILNTLD